MDFLLRRINFDSIFRAKKNTNHPKKGNWYFWWGKMDSNHRRHCQQIYSLSPLATREFPHMQFCQKVELVDGLEPPTC